MIIKFALDNQSSIKLSNYSQLTFQSLFKIIIHIKFDMFQLLTAPMKFDQII